MKTLQSAAAVAVLMSASSVMAQDVTLNYMSWDAEQLEIEMATIADFEAANPGVKVNAQSVPPETGYWPKVTAMAAAGDLPDVFMMSSGFVKEWGAAGNLADLSSVIAAEELAAYYDSAASIGVVGGERVAFPQNWVAPVLFYNIDAFNAAGVPLPTADWTWDDFLKAAQALTIDKDGDGTTDQWGMWLYGRYAQIEPWVFRNGGRLLNEDETELEFGDATNNALQFLTDLVLKEKVAPAPQDMEGIRQQDIFGMGMAAMWVDGSWNIANTREVSGGSFEWGIAQVPRGPDATDETVVAYAWADLLAVGKNSEHPELAWKFIQHMVGSGRTASDFLGGKVPAYKPIAESDEWLERDQLPANKDLLLEIGAGPVYSGFSRNWSAWRGYAASGSGGMNGELDEVLNGRKSLEDAKAAIIEYANDVLSQ